MHGERTGEMLVIGGGLIGLSCALAVAELGASATVLATPRPGSASAAAAGLLAPSIERREGPASAFAIAARDRYPDYLAWIEEQIGVRVPLGRDGILQVALSERGVKGLRRSMPRSAEWLEASALASLEPGLSHARGAVLHPVDGSIDNVLLLAALQRCAKTHARIRSVHGEAISIAFGTRPSVRCADGTVHTASRVVLAAGAWSGTLRGLPRPVPIEPVRGQMLAYDVVPISRPVYGPTGYSVPRPSGRTVVGSTMEQVGFAPGTSPEGRQRIDRAAREISPAFALRSPLEHWSGLRPATPDMQPIIGADPDEPELIYACGHSRNGVLMAPLTGDCVASIALDAPAPHDLAPFSIGRFAPSIDRGAAD